MTSDKSDQYDFVTYKNMSAGNKAKFGEVNSDVLWDSVFRMDDVDQM